jgi:hypothetical protein
MTSEGLPRGKIRSDLLPGPTSPAEVHITVATGWVAGRTDFDVSHETKIVKAALLYADRVTLASPRVAMLASFATILVADEGERAEVALQMAQVLPQNADLGARLNSLRAKKRKNVEERFALRDMERHLRETGKDLAAKVERLLTDAGVAELATAMSVGVVDLDPLGADEPGGVDQMPYRLGHLLADVVAPGATTYPLLDESTSGLLRAMIAEGAIPNVDLASAAEPALATSWIGEMEAFPDAEIEVVLEARAALRDPLIKFRSAVLRISRDLESTPLDEGWQREASESYRREVAPRLVELRELAEEKRVFALLRHPDTTDLSRKLMAAGIGLFGASAAAAPALLGAAVGITGDVAHAMYQRHQDVSEQQRANAFFFLFEAERRLKP